MGAIRIASVALIGAGALALAPSTAVAANGSANANPGTPAFSVTPSVIAPGGQVTLNATNCSGDATATSGVFNTVTIPKDSSRNATVDSDAKRGASYTVTFNCDGVRGTTQLTIAGGSPTASSTTRPTVSPTVRTTTPPLGVRGGLGGSTGDGLDVVELAVGAALIAVAGGGAFYVLRRRSAGRQH
ncbi:hypothetical protein ACGFW5_06590 [Streptomyces sp. NPDC048416]|uniref:hypothetical protein n=1 Tax=Streptomyces sp. NPDC048416 TaxID=3365546 RepID=UPI003722922E